MNTNKARGPSKTTERSKTLRTRRPEQPALRPLDSLNARSAALAVTAACDIALVIDGRGIIEDVRAQAEGLAAARATKWLGREWTDVVTAESRDKVRQLLEEAARSGASSITRHVNHPVAGSEDLPVMYSAVSLGPEGRVLAVGRDMTALSQLQRRLIDAQHRLESDYWRLRSVETRYRLLFDQASEAILILDAASSRVLEANPSARELLGLTARRLQGQAFPVGWTERSQRALQAAFERVKSTGRSEELAVRPGATERGALSVVVTLFTQDERPLLLLRMRLAGASQVPAAESGNRQASLALVMERSPDGFVVTDFDGRVLLANTAFVGLTQLAGEQQVVGESIERWLGRPGVDLNVMLATLRQQGTLRLFNTVVHGEHGAEAEVEISGVYVQDADPPCIGFHVRHVGRRLNAELRSAKSAPRSVEQLTQLVGRMPLKDLVRESTDLIEQLCIEAALQLTQGNRASAAEMLGLSRQSLYVKLRRYDLSDTVAPAAR